MEGLIALGSLLTLKKWIKTFSFQSNEPSLKFKLQRFDWNLQFPIELALSTQALHLQGDQVYFICYAYYINKLNLNSELYTSSPSMRTIHVPHDTYNTCPQTLGGCADTGVLLYDLWVIFNQIAISNFVKWLAA